MFACPVFDTVGLQQLQFAIRDLCLSAFGTVVIQQLIALNHSDVAAVYQVYKSGVAEEKQRRAAAKAQREVSVITPDLTIHTGS